MTQSNRARVGDRAGNVFSLPSGLALAHGLARPAEDFLSTCGRDIALFSDDAYALGPADGGIAEWQPLRPELVVEVAYDHMEGRRFRHTAQFRRWRTDKKPADCTYAQLEVVPPQELAKIFGTAR